MLYEKYEKGRDTIVSMLEATTLNGYFYGTDNEIIFKFKKPLKTNINNLKLKKIHNKLKLMGITNIKVYKVENRDFILENNRTNTDMYEVKNESEVEEGVEHIRQSLVKNIKLNNTRLNKKIINNNKMLENYIMQKKLYNVNELKEGLKFILFSPYRNNSRQPYKKGLSCTITNITYQDNNKIYITIQHKDYIIRARIIYDKQDSNGNFYATAIPDLPNNVKIPGSLKNMFYFVKDTSNNNIQNRKSKGGGAKVESNNF